ncbi:MAG: hypothetical protein LUF89_08135 [Ruminococcus sp.]|nr:hypothetical protein [Ruminococcus sp.]
MSIQNLQDLASPLILAHGDVIPNQGEDSYACDYVDAQYYQAVFDGCGGLGSQTYPQLGNHHTGAWITSREAAKVTWNFFQKQKLQFKEAEDAAAYQKALSSALRELKQKCTKDGGVQIGSSLQKSFPTTVGMIVACLTERNKLLCEALWAGDSRCYIMDQYGLAQLTIDDVDASHDAFENLKNDSRLLNLANADTDFQIHAHCCHIKLPVVLICLTDGGFVYFDSPMDFERVLLETLLSANNPQEWENHLGQAIKKCAGDDYTLMIMSVEFDSYLEMKNYFFNRFVSLKNNFIQPSKNADEETLKKLWEQYKASYYRWD